MSVFELKKVLIPPANPKEVGSAEDWNLIENKLSVGLPEDYKEIIMTYGTGKICDFIVLYNPFSKIENINLIKEALNDSEGYLQLKNNHHTYYKHRRFPEEGGMIPFAGTDNGDIIYWLPNGSPENWSIIVYESRGPDHEEFNLNTSDFIYNIITKKLNTRIFPQDFPHDPREFITI